jgi:hypothetical protein
MCKESLQTPYIMKRRGRDLVKYAASMFKVGVKVDAAGSSKMLVTTYETTQ